MTTSCPGCHGAGTEPSGTTHAGLAEHLACGECGPGCPPDCGCRVDAEPEHPESVAPCHPGATQSPDGSQGATQGLRGPESAVPRLLADRERLMDAPPVFPSRTRHHVVPPVRQSLPDTLAGGGFSEEFTEHLGALAIHHRKYGEHILGLGITCPCLPTIALSAVPHLETAPLPDTSDVRSVSPARDAVSDAEAAQWAALADAATEGPWVVDQDGSIGAPMAGLVCGEDGHPRPDCSECGTRVCHTSVMPGEPDAAFIATARTAVPRLLADRERLTGEVAQLREDLSRLASEWERELTSDHRPASALEAELDPAEFRTKPNPDQPDRCPSIDPHDTLQCTRRIHEDGQCQSGGIAWVKGTPRYMSDAERANRMEGMAERLAERLVDVEERLTGERDRARGTAAALEAENARLREGIERLCSDIDNPLRERHDESPHDLPEVAEDLRALLADTDSAQAEGGE